jgi:hypothetical protein
MEFQIAWCLFKVCAWNHFLHTKILIQDLEFFGKLQKFHLNSNLNYLVPASWGAIKDKSNLLLRRWPQDTVSHDVVSGRIGALDWVPKQCNQSEKPLLWHHSGLITPGNLRGLRMLLLACCFGSLGSKAGRINNLCHGGKTSQLNLPQEPGQVQDIHMENLWTTGSG